MFKKLRDFIFRSLFVDVFLSTLASFRAIKFLINENEGIIIFFNNEFFIVHKHHYELEDYPSFYIYMSKITTEFAVKKGEEKIFHGNIINVYPSDFPLLKAL